ncbi:MAG TPA: alpha/beta hydrolase fold domain-containing protein [Phycisphaerales bacterium]|nr:alpha/beta hydrolase fold domain-containing protein [Phycisphaerales bacterium]
MRKITSFVAGICAIGASVAFGTGKAAAFTDPTFEHVAYATDSFMQHLDVYLPDSFCGPRPCVIYFFGGGWVVGSKDDVAPYVDTLLARGFAVASVDYEYSYQALFPAQIHDVKGAIRFLRAHAEEYQLDPNRFAVFGDSAGAYLATLVGTAGDVPELEGTTGGNLKYSSRVQAAADFYGPIDLWSYGEVYPSCSSSVSQLFGVCFGDLLANQDNPDWADEVALVNSAIPQNYITLDDPPFQVVHGDSDSIVPPSQGVDLYNALVAGGVPATLYLLPGIGHEDVPMSAYETVFDNFAALLMPPVRPADLTCDGQVNIDDLTLIITGWGVCVSTGSGCQGDVNHDGQVNIDDLTAVILDWG